MILSEQKLKLIEENRKRYEDLKIAGQGKSPRTLPPPTAMDQSPLESKQILNKKHVPAGWYENITIHRGTALRLINTDGMSSISLVAWNARDRSERINHADTIKVQWSAKMQKGRIILSDMGRVMFSILEDTCAAHDCIVGGSTQASTTRKFGEGYRCTRDNFILAAGKFGLSRADIPLAITFFAPVGVDPTGRFTWTESKRKAGDFVDLQAEMDLLIAISNCPHPLDPAKTHHTSSIEAIQFMPDEDASNFCRSSSDEAIRAFENTDALVTV